MKIAIVTNFLYPEGLGGTELYCHKLAEALVERGNEVYWFVPHFKNASTVSETRGKGITIVKFAAVNEEGKSDLAFTKQSFLAEMQQREIRIAHFNDFGGDEGISPALLSASRNAGIAAIATLHLANYICSSATMHVAGVVPCNGKMILSRCSSCNMFSGKTNSPFINLTLVNLFDKVLKTGLLQSVPRVKRYLAGVNLKSSFINILKENADAVISLTQWFKAVLLINGIEEKKIVYLPQVSPEITPALLHTNPAQRKDFVFIGRVDKQKGIDLILDMAARLKMKLPGTVIDIYGPSYGPYVPENRVMDKPYPGMDQHDNIRYKGVLHPDDVLPVMNRYKAIILPSLVAEMAPLIIMEANKLKLPVIASAVPGSVELINQYDCGLIFKYADADDLFARVIEIETGEHHFSFTQPVENSFYFTAGKYEEIYLACLDKYN